MLRFPDWPERLAAHVAARAHAPFKWGKHANDCASGAAAWVRSATGEDALDDLPDWSDEAGAIAAMRTVGGLARGLAGRFAEIPVGLAQRGDIGLARVGMTLGAPRTFAVVVVDETVVGPGADRLSVLPRSALSRAFRVGRP